KPSYGPGEEAIAHLHVEKVEGGLPLIGEEVVATVQIDGTFYKANGEAAANSQAAEIHTHTDALGNVSIRFKRPATIDKGAASFSVTFTDRASYEALVKSIPLVVKKLNIEFFPEGGDLIAGVKNRVYLQARTMLDKPAQIKGSLVDNTGAVVVPNI